MDDGEIARLALVVSFAAAGFTGWTAVSAHRSSKATKAIAKQATGAVFNARIIGPDLVITNTGNGVAKEVALSFPDAGGLSPFIPEPGEHESNVLYPGDRLTRMIRNPAGKPPALGITSVTIHWTDVNGPHIKAHPLPPPQPGLVTFDR